MVHLLKDEIYKPSRGDIEEALKRCITCLKSTALDTRQSLRPVIARSPAERYTADLICLKKYSAENYGFCYLFVVLDSFSKYLMIKSLRSKTASETTGVIHEIFCVLGKP
eukprot:GHVP01016115.1.p1 GENE.GHVP01016115.1~~GHVP01016115.1.p1  ORF type:complete len:110 (-),score=9.52 GHVP01016115.1:674-1003(-)